MIRQIYNRQELPMADLERIGLAKNGQLSLDEDDLNALAHIYKPEIEIANG